MDFGRVGVRLGVVFFTGGERIVREERAKRAGRHDSRPTPAAPTPAAPGNPTRRPWRMRVAGRCGAGSFAPHACTFATHRSLPFRLGRRRPTLAPSGMAGTARAPRDARAAHLGVLCQSSIRLDDAGAPLPAIDSSTWVATCPSGKLLGCKGSRIDNGATTTVVEWFYVARPKSCYPDYTPVSP